MWRGELAKQVFATEGNSKVEAARGVISSPQASKYARAPTISLNMETSKE